MSSHLLVDLVDLAPIDLLILDEAHHLAGIVASDTSGEGRTRKLMMRACELGIKRLSLTYTPRIIRAREHADDEILTMDDDRAFGRMIGNLRIRDLITRGILPDYHVWAFRDARDDDRREETKHARDLAQKVECLVEAWNARECVHGDEHAILHHMIVFAQTVLDAQKSAQLFAKRVAPGTCVLHARAGCDIGALLAQFEAAPRAILVNCFVLGEGVDIPCANAVAIMYPKHACGQITQMIMRAGRWYPGKSTFHVIIPVLDLDNDLDGFAKVLVALASHDDRICDEICVRAAAHSAQTSRECEYGADGAAHSHDHVICEMFEGLDVARLCWQFAAMRALVLKSLTRSRILAICEDRRIDTSYAYERLRIDMPEMPADPRGARETWYDLLHPRDDVCARIPIKSFALEVLALHKLYIASTYDEWRGCAPERAKYPSAQHINDGYFGSAFDNFNAIIDVFVRGAIPRSTRC